MDYRSLFILSFATVTLAVPIQNLKPGLLGQTSCAKQCTDKSKFSYTPGETYKFTYEGETKTSIHGATKEQTGLKITATAHIEVLSKCELSLKLRDAAVYVSEPGYPQKLNLDTQTKEFKQQLEEHVLRFSFQDGIVEEVCPTKEESEWALNIKKGILSAVQNSMDSFKTEQDLVEVDIAGKCRTQYKLTQQGHRTFAVKKIKDINSCLDRHGFDSSIDSMLYALPSNYESLPIMKSTHECDQKISTDGHIQSVLCHEVHLFKPFSKGDSGAATEVTQKLSFISKSTGISTRMAEVSRKDSLLFGHVHGERALSVNKKQAKDKLTQLCLSTEDGIRPETPALFAELVSMMKKLDVKSMDQLYKEVKTTSFCPNNMERAKKFYLDAIPMVGTGAAVRQITQLIINNDVTGVFAESWLVALSFIQHPTKDMLTEISKLMNTIQGTKVLLPLSTLVHTYCSSHDCQKDKEVQDVVSKLKLNLGNDCSGSNIEKILLTLRAVGNIEATQTLVPVLNSCFGKKTNSMGVRVAAVEAFRRMSCEADRNNLMALYRDSDEDSELRIAAYIQVMKCPTDYVLQQIKQTLLTEEVNQVGSFVWTHLTNLKETSNPHKENIKNMLESDDLPKKFDLDQRKFSRNYEWSHYSEEWNAGGMIDSNLVWSPESFIPRSIMTNFTVNLFGHSVNLLEIGGRAEGLDYLLESYFGPAGYFSGGTRAPTNAKDHKNINTKNLQKIDSNFNKKVEELKGSMYMRMFGNEVYFKQFGKSASSPKPDFNFLEAFQKLAKGNEVSITKSETLLDSSIIYPTALGLPLNLTVNGTVSVDLRGKAKIDLTKPHKAILIDGIIKPSGAVEIASMMSVDAFFTKSGIKMTSTLHSSTAVSAKMEIKKKEEYVFHFDFPKDKSEIISVESALFMVHKNLEKRQTVLDQNKAQRKFCSGYTLVRLTGMELCGEISHVKSKTDSPSFPLTGPAKTVLTLHKRDTHKGYQLQINKINNRKLVNFKVFYDTPGSKMERATGFELDLHKQDKILKMELTSPWKKARFTGSMVDTKAVKKVSGIVTVDGKTQYQMEAKVDIQGKGPVSKYKPAVLISYPDADPITLAGTVDLTHNAKKTLFDANIVVKGVQKEPITFQGTFKNTDKVRGVTLKYIFEKKKQYQADFVTKTNKQKQKFTLNPRVYISTPTKVLVSFMGTVNIQHGKAVKVDLNLDKVFSVPIVLKADSRKIAKGKRVIYKGRANYKGPKKTSIRLRYTFDKKAKMMTAMLKGDYNFVKVAKWAKDSFTFTKKLINRSTKTLQNIGLNTHFKSSRYSKYNNKLDLKLVNRFNKLAELKSSFDYGRTYTSKVNKQRITVNGLTKYNIRKNTANVNYNVSFSFPVMELDSTLTGQYAQTKKNVKSSMQLRYDDKNTIITSIKLNDETKKFPKYSGSMLLKYPGRDIKIEATGAQKTKSQGITKWTIQHKKGAKSLIIVQYKKNSNTSYDVKSNVRIYQQKPISIAAKTDINMKSPVVELAVTHGNDDYGLKASGKYLPHSYGQLSSYVLYPARKIVLELEGGQKAGQYVGKVDVSWDALKDTDKRVLVQMNSRMNTWRDFNLYFITEYPNNKFSCELRNLVKANFHYKTSGAVSWSPKDRISVEVELLDNRKKYRGVTEATAAIQTPFKYFEEYKVTIGRSYTRTQYEGKMGLTWAKKKTITITAATKYPALIEDLDLDIKISTPFQKVGNPQVKLINKMPSMKTQSGRLSLSWGKREFIVIDTDGETTSYELYKRDFKRNIGFSSSILNYEKILFNISHSDDLEKFESQTAITHNEDKYLYKFEMNHKINGWQIDNSGTFDIKGPYDTMILVWSHKNSKKDVRSKAAITWGNKQRFTAELNGEIQSTPSRKLTSRFQMNIPSKTLKRVDAVLEHEDKIGFIKTLGKIKADRKNIGTIDLNYLRSVGKADWNLGITSIYMEDIKAKASVESAVMPIKSHLSVQWHPSKVVALNVKHFHVLNKLESTVTLTSPFEKARKITAGASHKLKGLDWVAEISVEYAPSQTIRAVGTYQLDIEKKARFYIESPFPTFKTLDTGISFKGDVSRYHSTFDFRIDPLVNKIAASSTWNRGLSTKGTFRLDTPYKQYPYMQALISSDQTISGRESKFMLEYFPTQKIELTGKYVKKGDKLNGDFVFKTPKTRPATIAYSQAGNLDSFENRAEIRYMGTEKIIVDTTFGQKPKVFGTFSMESPIKGYELVKFGFNHEGGKNWKNMRTQFVYGTDGNNIELESMLNIISTTAGKLMVKTPFKALKIAQIGFSHDGKFPNIHTHAKAIYNENEIESNGHLSHNMKITEGKINLSTSSNTVKFAEFAFNHDGTPKNFRTHVETTFNDRKYESETIFSHDADIIAGTYTLKTPISGWEETVVTFSRDGPMTNIKTSGEIRYQSKRIAGTFQHLLQKDDVASSATLVSPYTDDILIKINQNTRKRGFTTDFEASMGTENSLKTHTNYRLRNGDLTLELEKTATLAGKSYKSSFDLKHTGTIEAFNTKATAKYNKDKIAAVVTFSGNSADDLEGSIKIDTSFKGYTEMDFIAKNKKSGNKYVTEIEGSVEQKNKISATSSVLVNLPKTDIEMVFKTPFEGYESTSVVCKTSKKSDTYLGEVKAVYSGGKILVTETKITADIPNIDVQIAAKTPYSGYEKLSAKFINSDKSNRFETELEMKYPGRTYSAVSSILADSPTNIDAKLEITTPITGYEKLSAKLVNMEKNKKYDTEIEIDFPSNTYTAVSTIKATHPFSVDIKATTPIKDYENIVLVLKTSMADNQYASKNELILGEKKFSSDVSVTVDLPTIDVKLDITHPGDKISAELVNKKIGNKYTSTVSYTFRQKKRSAKTSVSVDLPTVDLEVNVNKPMLKDIMLPVEEIAHTPGISTDITLVVRNLADGDVVNSDAYIKMGKSDLGRIKSSFNPHTFQGDVTVTKGQDKVFYITYKEQSKNSRRFETTLKIDDDTTLTMGSECKLDLPDIDCSFKLDTPFHKVVSVSIDNSVTDEQIATNAGFSYGTGMIYSVEFSLSPSPTNLKLNLKLTTPIEGFKSSDLQLTHVGDIDDFQCSFSVSSDELSPINVAARLKYKEIYDMDCSVEFTSSIPSAEHLQFDITNQEQNKEYSSNIEIYLDQIRKISIKGSGFWAKEKNGFNINIETPFDQLKNFKYKSGATMQALDEEQKHVKTTSFTFVSYNDKTYVDTDRTTEIKTQSDWLYNDELIYRSPKEMSYSYYGKKENNVYTVKADINWDKLDVNSNVQIEGQANISNDKDMHNQIELEVTHPLRTVVVEATLHHTKNMDRSKVIITWDKDAMQKAGFDIHRDGRKTTAKIITPPRSIEVMTKYDDKYPIVWSESAIYWDADRNRDKTASFKVTSASKTSIDHRIDIRMPTFGKAYAVHTTITQNKGSKILDAKTEISYSTERRKTIVLTANIDDLSTQSSKNYSWEVGVKQKFTKLDIVLSGHAGNSDDAKTIGFGMDYLTSKRERKNMDLRAEINKLQRQLSVSMNGPSQSYGVVGRIESEEPLSIAIDTIVNGTQSEKLKVKVDKKKRQVEIHAKYDNANPKSTLHMKAELPTRKDFQAEIYRTGDFETVTDSLINVQLKKSRLLHSKINWRPKMFAEVMKYGAQCLKKCGNEANTFMLDVGTEIAKELASKDSAISKEILAELKPYGDELANKMTSMQAELISFKQKLKTMKENNDLYLGDMNTFYDNSIQQFIVQYGKSMKSLKACFKSMKDKMKEISNEIKTYPFEEKYTEYVTKMSAQMQELKKEAHDWMMKEVKTMTGKVKRSLQNLRQKIQELLVKAKAVASEKLDIILQHPDVKEMQQQMSTLAKNVPSLPEYDVYVNKVKSSVKKLRVVKHYNDVIKSAHKVIKDQYDLLQKDPDFAKFQELIKDIYEEMLTGYEYVSIKKSLMKMAKQFHADTKKFITEDIAQMKILGLDKSRVITFDPENGKIEVEIYIPTKMETLDRLPMIPVAKVKGVVKEISQTVQKFTPEKNFRFWDLYYRYRPASFNPVDWIPPFKAYGFVAGNRHFVTFDGKKYDFSGDCSFVLTRDLVDNNFTVILNYDKKSQKIASLLVLAEVKTIEIFPDFTAKIDNKRHEFPYIFHKLSLERIGNWIKLDTGRGLVITGDLPNNVYSFEVSGWYFGKLAGMLGTYNYEQYDDMTTSKGRIANNLDRFSNSWEVSKNCRPVGNKIQPIVQDENQQKFQKCAKFFRSHDSEFRPCYKQVEPVKAFEMCLSTGDICAAAAFYMKQCQKVGVHLSHPKDCVQCVAPNDETFGIGETIEMSSASDDYQFVQSADTIIIVEEKPCNKEISKHIGSFVYEIEQELNKAGLSNNKYGLLGFNKKGSHSHTMEGKLLNDATKFVMAVESLTFTSRKTDVMDAIYQSASYPFRTGVVKNIILMQCGTCSEFKSIKYHQVKRMLQSRDIKLHILRDHEFMLGNRIPKKKILGVDKDRKYILQNSRDQSLAGMVIPVDTCSHIALQTNGSIFDSRSFLLKKVRDRKMATDTISNRVAKTSTHSECQICQCEADETGASRTVCRKCYSEVSDYFSRWWRVIRHPMTLKEEFDKHLKDYLQAAEGWSVLKN